MPSNTQQCAKMTPRGYRCHLRRAQRTRRAVLVGLPARPGFNEDRRICPIKTSYKDSSRSTLIRKTSNLDFAAATSSYPRAITAICTCLPLSLSLLLSGSAFRTERETRGEADEDLWNLLPSKSAMSCRFYRDIGNRTRALLKHNNNVCFFLLRTIKTLIEIINDKIHFIFLFEIL